MWVKVSLAGCLFKYDFRIGNTLVVLKYTPSNENCIVPHLVTTIVWRMIVVEEVKSSRLGLLTHVGTTATQVVVVILPTKCGWVVVANEIECVLPRGGVSSLARKIA